jgi:hypothetical protein
MRRPETAAAIGGGGSLAALLVLTTLPWGYCIAIALVLALVGFGLAVLAVPIGGTHRRRRGVQAPCWHVVEQAPWDWMDDPAFVRAMPTGRSRVECLWCDVEFTPIAERRARDVAATHAEAHREIGRLIADSTIPKSPQPTS